MIELDRNLCDVCCICAGVCEVNAIVIERQMIHIDQENCIMCRACVFVCPVGALTEGKSS